MTRQSTPIDQPYRLVAHEQRQQRYLGAVASISPSGLTLLSDSPLTPDHILELQLACPDPAMGLAGAYLGIRVLWCRQQSEGYWVGMEIISVDPQLRHRLSELPHPQTNLEAEPDSRLSA